VFDNEHSVRLINWR